ncbi:unnamed protein product, partial [Vitis vinifera]
MLPCGTLLKTIIFDSSFIPKNSVQYTTKLLTRNQESSPCQFDRTHVSALLRFCTKALPFLFCKLAHLKLGFSSAFRNFNVEALCSCLISSAYEESPINWVNLREIIVELSDHVLLSNPNSSSNFQGSTPIDSFLDDFLKNTRTCTHTHTCNPPGPDAAHTHTCYHTHTQVFASEEDEVPNNKEHLISKVRRPSGNREAVRKYREKKKAHTAYLEEEVKKLRLLNQQLVKKLQGQAVLEAEVLRLRSLLLDLRGKIDNELGVFPFQKQCNTTLSFKEGDCGLQSASGAIDPRCEMDLPCFHPHPAVVDCRGNINDMVSAEGHTMDTVEALNYVLTEGICNSDISVTACMKPPMMKIKLFFSCFR